MIFDLDTCAAPQEQKDSQTLPIPMSFAPPEGYSPEVHAKFIGWRAYYGLPVKADPLREVPMAVVFQLCGRRCAMSQLDPHFRAARKTIASMAAQLKVPRDKDDCEVTILRNHRYAVTIASPIVCVGEYGLQDAWNRGFQQAHWLRQLLLSGVPKQSGKDVDLLNGLLPGITPDGYLTAYPKRFWLTSYVPHSGSETQWTGGHLIRDFAILSGDRIRRRTLESTALAVRLCGAKLAMC